jgi:hypothetical protein
LQTFGQLSTIKENIVQTNKQMEQTLFKLCANFNESSRRRARAVRFSARAAAHREVT